MRRVLSTLALLVVFSVSAFAGQIGMTLNCPPEQTCSCPPEQTCVFEGQIGMTGANSAASTGDAGQAADTFADAKTVVDDLIGSINIYGIAALLAS